MLDVIRKYDRTPFSYGLDCCQFVGDCLESITGNNPMNGFAYKNKREAYRIIKSYGSLEKAITATLGEPYDGIKDGDVCTISANDGTEAAGIVFNNRIIARVEDGVMDYPLERALRVWET